MCSLLFCLSFRLKSNKELLESNFSIVGKLAVRLLIHVIIGDTSLLQLWSTVHKFKVCDWQKRMQNWINLIACKCNYLNVHPSTKTQQTTIFSIQKNWHLSLDHEKFFATDIMYIVCLWNFLEAYKCKRYARSKMFGVLLSAHMHIQSK